MTPNQIENQIEDDENEDQEWNPEDDEIEFNTCDDCDLPDACEDFGCAIKAGIKLPDLP